MISKNYWSGTKARSYPKESNPFAPSRSILAHPGKNAMNRWILRGQAVGIHVRGIVPKPDGVSEK